ncbi:hypothetical protein LTR10_001479 [Elasticomyces elasticus]|nr:hypothetical protein LTR10_001479 [Elasticomyces elasticus]KAK4974981.1 hypothetical protein LTR42_004190 [Elasticomyces elasticus]
MKVEDSTDCGSGSFFDWGELTAHFKPHLQVGWRSKTTSSEVVAKIDGVLRQNVTLGGLSVAVSSTTNPKPYTFAAGCADVVKQTPIEDDHSFGIGSITKVFVALITLQLIEEGRLHLSDTVKQHLQSHVYHDIDCAKPATIEQLLRHRAGIDSWEEDPIWIVQGRGRSIRPAYIWRREHTLEYVRRPKIFAPVPGEYYYASTNYTLLGLIIEEVTHTTAESEIRRRILDPLKMDHTFLEGFEDAKNEHAPRRYHLATARFQEVAGVSPAFSQVSSELIDVTGSNLSVSWLAGGMSSTTTDLLKLGRAMQQGLLH